MGPIDVEWIALEAGLKPALRLSCEVAEAESVAERYRKLGGAVLCTTGLIGPSRRCLSLVYVAPSASEAEQLCALERPLVAHEPLRDRLQHAALCAQIGERLGYPHCCIAAFCNRLSNATEQISDTYLAVRDAWVPAPEPLLNSLLLPERIRLITFQPCRFDCTAALAYAREVFACVQRKDRQAAAALERGLTCTLVVSPQGWRALVSWSTEAPRTIVQSAAPRDQAGRVVDPESAAQVALWEGKSVQAQGLLDNTGTPPAVCVDFAWSAGVATQLRQVP